MGLDTGKETKVEPNNQEDPTKTVLEGLSPEQLQEEVRKLRAENAAKRVAAKEAQEKAAAEAAERQRIVEEHKAAVAELARIKEEATLANASEIEKIQHELEKQKALIQERDQALEQANAVLARKDKAKKIRELKDAALSVIVEEGYKFKNTYERQGFLDSITSQGSTSDMTEEQAVEVAKKFLEENFVAPESVPPGPKSRATGGKTILQQIDELIERSRREPYNKELKRELDALVKEAESKIPTPKRKGGVFRNQW